jgi:hypothetical protein
MLVNSQFKIFSFPATGECKQVFVENYFVMVALQIIANARKSNDLPGRRK